MELNQVEGSKKNKIEEGKIENRKKINKTKNSFFQKINKIDRLLFILTKKKAGRHKLSISEYITTDSTDTKIIKGEC